MRSMTGYACREISIDSVIVTVEIKSYNSRFLDMSIHLPSWLSPLESDVRKYFSSRFIRGKIDIYIKVKREEASFSVKVNKNAALAYTQAIGELADSLGINEKPGLGLILGLEGVLEIDAGTDVEKYRVIVNNALAEAADMLDAERQREGAFTCEDILKHIGILEESLKAVNSRLPEIETLIKENLRSRFMELLGDSIDENRILAETAVLLVKYSISEEVSRLNSHLTEFRREIDINPAPGKKLDFLSQEINREINTIGSKTPMLDISRAVVEMKNALENIREQLRNVE